MIKGEQTMAKEKDRQTFSEILPTSGEFKQFWKQQGPFKYALTSAEYPPILLEPEEWLFSNDLADLLKRLMKWNDRKMAIVEAPFNPRKQNVLKPDGLSPWKINHFPEEWERSVCDSFTPVGHLTCHVADIASALKKDLDDGSGGESEIEGHSRFNTIDIADIERAFFKSLEADVEKIGYIILKPEPLLGEEDVAYIKDYLDEWQADEEEGL